jgi:hypothetical protein
VRECLEKARGLGFEPRTLNLARFERFASEVWFQKLFEDRAGSAAPAE